MRTMTNKAILTVNEAAAVLGKRPETVRRWIAAGIIKATYHGPHVFIPAAAIKPLARRVCTYCGKTFTPQRYATRGAFCSKACIWQAAYERHKAEHPATRAPGRPPKHPQVKHPPAKLSAVNPRLRAVVAMIRDRDRPR